MTSINRHTIVVRGYWDLYPQHSPEARNRPARRCTTSSYRPNRTREGTLVAMTRLQGAYYKAIRDHLKGCQECRKDAGGIAQTLLVSFLGSRRPKGKAAPGKETYAMMAWLHALAPADPRAAHAMGMFNLMARAADSQEGC